METDRADVEEVEELGTGIANLAEADGVKVDRAEANQADKPNTGPADRADHAEANGADI